MPSAPRFHISFTLQPRNCVIFSRALEIMEAVIEREIGTTLSFPSPQIPLGS